MKKSILAIIIIIIILAIILGIKIIMPKDNKNYTVDEIRNKILSAFDYTNYTYEYIQDGEKTVKRVKGNIIVTENDENLSWVDGESNMCISIDKKQRKYTTITLNSTTKEFIYKKDFLDMKSLLDTYGDKLYYIDEETYNFRKCLKIQAGEGKAKYLIDKETGFVLRYEAQDGTVAEFNIEINNVTDNDIKMPDLTEYERV